MQQLPLISIEGIIGAGKSTTAKTVAARLGHEFMTEQFDTHPFIDTFYTDPVKYGFEAELVFLSIHFNQLNTRDRSKGWVIDFSLPNDLIYCHMLVEDKRLKLLEDLNEELSKQIGFPDLTVFLDIPPEIAQSRVLERGRDIESGITVEYLDNLRSKFLTERERVGNPIVTVALTGNETPEVVTDKALEVIHRELPELSVIV